MSVNTHINGAIVVIATFDCYRVISLKQATRTPRKGKRAPRAFHISNKSNIDKVIMSKLFSSEETKQSISHYYTKTTELQLRKRQFRFIVSANGKTQFSCEQETFNNHEEVDALIIHALKQMKHIKCNVIVHAAATGVFFLLLKHSQAGGFVNITALMNEFGVKTMHCCPYMQLRTLLVNLIELPINIGLKDFLKFMATIQNLKTSLLKFKWQVV